MSDSNAPSWLVQDNATSAPSTTSNSTADKPKKSGGVFKMFSKEAATAHVEKAATDHVVSKAKNITNYHDDGFTPAWATSSNYTPPTDVESGAGQKPVESSASAAPSGPVELNIDPETLKKIKFYHIILRILYMLSSSLMATAAGLSLVLQTNVSAAFFAIYVIFFCLLLCCFEVGLNLISSFVAVNFGFLYTLTGRVIFILFVGAMSYSLSIFGKVAMGILFAVLAFHALIMCCFPKYSQYVRQKDYFGSKGK